MTENSERTATRVPTRIGHYRVLGVAGEWARGWLLRGYDEILNKDVLVKTLYPAEASQPEACARFAHEARITACLNHPNIISICELGERDGLLFMAFEALRGESLAHGLKRGISLKSGLPVCQQVLEGLAWMHAKAIIHRDVKPGGIFMCADGTAKIMDLWLAKMLGPTQRRTGTALRLATPSYLAPERVCGDDGDGRGDLFSLGCVLYEMVTGQKPFRAHSVTEVLFKIVRDEPDMGSIPSGSRWERLRAVINRALAKRPEDRYSDARAMLLDVRLALEELGQDADWVQGSSWTPPQAKPN